MMRDVIPVFGPDFIPWIPPKVQWPWLWVYCEDPHCGHVRAVPVAPWLIRWGIEPKDICKALRASLYCGVCGRRGCHFGNPLISAEGIEAFPAVGKQIRINGPRRWNETYPAAEERNRAEYLAKYPTGDALGEFRGIGRLRFMCNLYSVKVGQKHMSVVKTFGTVEGII